MPQKLSSTGDINPPKSLILAVKRILKPLVKVLLHFQVTYPFLSELLKGVYVEVAEQEFQIPGKKQTDSRISLITGVHRKDAKRLRGELNEGDIEPSVVSIGAQVVSKWITDPLYLDEKDKPISLPLRPDADNDNANFESLVQSVGRQDFGARALLDEWLRLGVVTVNNEHVSLNSEAFIPEKGLDEKSFFFGLNVGDHISAAGFNISSTDQADNQSPPFFERCVYYDGLNQASIDKLNQLSEKEGMKYLKKINEHVMKLKEKQSSNSIVKNSKNEKPGDDGNSLRFNTGLYVYHKQEDE